VDKLQMVPPAKMIEAMQAAEKAGHRFAPVVDGGALPSHPFDPQAPAISAEVPMIIGFTKDESRGLMVTPDALKLDAAGLTERVKTALKLDDAKAQALIDGFKKAQPDASPTDLYFAITTMRTKANAVTQAERKIKLRRQTAVYVYESAWEVPAADGRLKAAHGTDLPTFFDNADAAPGLGGSMPERRKLADRASRAFMTFAKTGSPSYEGLGMPKWPGYTPEKRQVMVFDLPECKLVENPDKDQLAAYLKVVKV
jgi:para-nitrobenzyl esterase